MSDIASVFHWPPDVMDAMSIEELIVWRNRAVSQWNKMNAPPKTPGKG